MKNNKLIGIVLIAALFFGMTYYQYVTGPTPEQIEAEQKTADSIANAATVAAEQKVQAVEAKQTEVLNLPDSAKLAALGQQFGAFAAAAANNTAKDVAFSNDEVTVTFAAKGGHISSVVLNQHKSGLDKSKQVDLMADARNKFQYVLPTKTGVLSTTELYFTPTVAGNVITMTAPTTNGGSFQQVYTIKENYEIDYKLKFNNLETVLDASKDAIKFNWKNYLQKYEKSEQIENTLSSQYWRDAKSEVDHCSCTGDDTEEPEQKIEWISHTQQFFNSTLIADNAPFSDATLTTFIPEDDSTVVKVLSTDLSIPVANKTGGVFDMTMYVGPNDYETLAAYDKELQNIIPYGNSIFGMINRHIVRPMFNFLYGLIGSAGWAIILMTVLVKMALYPLTYKMLRSQSKMSLLKPLMEKVREKHKDDQQQAQMETMKLYRETGVSPLGGCLPMVLQMPIWFALYRYFPANIDFRQKAFLWADDLSSYDSFFVFSGPFGIDHLSLFTILWSLSTLIYTWYNSKYLNTNAMAGGGETAQMQMKMMKYMQYGMPIMFLFFFNSYAAGLTCYLLFSNLINIIQTVGTKEIIINTDKLQAEIDAKKAQPKKKGKFAAKMEEAMKQQRAMQEKKKK